MNHLFLRVALCIYIMVAAEREKKIYRGSLLQSLQK